MANETLNGLKAGDKAPDFELPGDDGKTHKLSAYKGQPVILYFYPRDNTPGCTTEACEFRDNLNRVTGKGAVVFGVSKDSIKSHEKFRDKYDLNFPLLADEDTKLIDALGAWVLPVVEEGRFLGLVSKSTLFGIYRNELRMQTSEE